MFTTPSGKPYASIVSAGLGGTVKTRREQLLAYE
ncbi:MAG: CRISPR-associated endonuclease Cas1, partial [Chloroflexi bacterium]